MDGQETTTDNSVKTGADSSAGTSDLLNPPQAEAVEHAFGPLIVFAGAGSGKTRVITYRIANLIAEHSVPPYRILAVTFTNKAAQEMKHRLGDILGNELAGQLWLGTFHSACVRMIRRYHEALSIGKNFVIYDTADQKAVMKRVLKDLKLDEKRTAPNKLLARIQKAKQEVRGPDDMLVNNYFDEIAQRCYRAYEANLQQSNALDFTDLLLVVLRLAERKDDEAAQHLRQRFSHVLVDEFQDVNLVQYRLVRAFAASTQNLCVVGDDDQSIYRWRGADVRNIRNFTKDFPDAKLVKLEQNYRSSRNVVSAALGVIGPARDRQPKELWTANPEGERVRIVHAANERDEAAFVVQEVARLIEEGTFSQEIAVFYRTHAQSRVLEEAMRGARIPYQIIGGHRFFDRAEVKDILSYLKMAANPHSDVDLLRIINRPARKIGGKTVERLAAFANENQISCYDALLPVTETDRLGSAAKKSLRAFAAAAHGWVAAAETAGPADLAQTILDESGYLAWLQGQDSVEADARVANLQELESSIAEYEDEKTLTDEPATLSDYLTSVSLLSDADQIEDVPRVPMMSIHASKGLEFDAVFVTGMEEGLFPLRGQEPGEEEELEEERRLAYVAYTRARKLLSISHANTRTIFGQMRYNQASRFIADIPPKNQRQVLTGSLAKLARKATTTAQLPTWRDRSWTASDARAPAKKAAAGRVVEPVYDDFDGDDGFEMDPAAVRPGFRVKHAKFGSGIVRSVDKGRDPIVTVEFAGWSAKRIKLSYLRPA